MPIKKNRSTSYFGESAIIYSTKKKNVCGILKKYKLNN